MELPTVGSGTESMVPSRVLKVKQKPKEITRWLHNRAKSQHTVYLQLLETEALAPFKTGQFLNRSSL